MSWSRSIDLRAFRASLSWLFITSIVYYICNRGCNKKLWITFVARDTDAYGIIIFVASLVVKFSFTMSEETVNEEVAEDAVVDDVADEESEDVAGEE